MQSLSAPRVAAVIGAGALVAFSLPPWGFWPLAVIGIALFAALTRRLSPRAQAVAAWCFTLAWFAPGMGWMWHLTAPGYLVAVPLFASLHALAALVAARAAYLVVAAPLAHALAEALRFSTPFGGVPLATLAITHADSPVAAVTRVGGPILLSYVVLQVGFLIPYLWTRRSWRAGSALIATVGAVVVIAWSAPSGVDVGEQITIAAVQGGGPQGTLAINTRARDVVERHLAATQTIPDETALDMVVWPENVIDVDSFYDSVEREEIAAEAARLGVPFAVGITEDVDATYFTNAQVVVNTDGTLGDRYDKVKRVPFGEFIPLRGLLEALGAPVDRIPRDALPGDGVANLRIADTVVGVAISWEVFFSGRANEGIENGGSLLLNPTNGSSYTGTILQSQQIASSRLRAIETGRWVVQVSPTGFSAFVSPTGEVFDRTGVSEQRVIIREVPLRIGRTLYSRIGDQTVLILFVAALLTLLAQRRSLFRRLTTRQAAITDR
jgi:apolipoprotein N-acyltransferase